MRFDVNHAGNAPTLKEKRLCCFPPTAVLPSQSRFRQSAPAQSSTSSASVGPPGPAHNTSLIILNVSYNIRPEPVLVK